MTKRLLVLCAVLATACSERGGPPTLPQLNPTSANHEANAGSVEYVSQATMRAAAPSEVIMFNDIANSGTVHSTDFTTAGVGGMRNVGTGTITVSGISGTVTKAILYWHGPTSSSDPAANANVRVNGIPVTGANIGFSSDNCWGFANSQGYKADITMIVAGAGNGNYSLTQFGGGFPVNTNGASIVVYFNDGNTANDRDVVSFEGNDSNIPNPFDAPGWNVTLSGINYTTGTANLQMHVADGQGFTDDAIRINALPFLPVGQHFDGNTVGGISNLNGRLWDIRSFNVTSFLTPGPNTLTMTTGAFSDCLALVVALVDLPAGAAPPPANRPPVARITGPATTPEGTTVVISGETSSDPDNNPLSFAWTVNGSPAGGNSASLSVDAPDGPATVTIELTVDDGKGATSSASHTLGVSNVAPTVDASGDITITSGQTASFSGTFSDPGVNDADWTYAWSFGVTGSSSTQPGPITASRLYCAAGPTPVSLTVTDKDGGSGSDDLIVNVQRLDVTIRVLPETINLNGNKSNANGQGGMIIVHVSPSGDFNPAALDPATLRLSNGSGPGTPVAQRNNGSYYFETTGSGEVIIHFDRGDMIANGDLNSVTTQLMLLGTEGTCRQVQGVDGVHVIH